MSRRARWLAAALLAGGGVAVGVAWTRGGEPCVGEPGGRAAGGPSPAGEGASYAADGSRGARLQPAAAAGHVHADAPRGPAWELAVRVTRAFRPPARSEGASAADDADAPDREASAPQRPAEPCRARVRLVHRVGGEMTFLGEATSGPDGVAVLDLSPLRALPPLALEVGVGALVSAAGAETAWVPVSERVSMLPPAEEPRRQECEVELEPARRVRGRVVDASGKPVAGATVSAEGPRPSFDASLTDADGRYEVAGDAERGETFLVVANHPALGVAGPREFEGGDLPDVELDDLVLTTDGIIEGEAVWADGSPATDVPVEVVGMGSLRGRTDARGAFRLAATAEGAFEVVAGGDRSTRQTWTTGGPPLRFTLNAYRVRVRVRDGVGRPLRGMQVDAFAIPTDRAAALARGDVGSAPIPKLPAEERAPSPWRPLGSPTAEAFTAGPAAEAVLFVPAGLSVLVCAGPDPAYVAEAAVEGLGVGGERSLELVLPPRSARGTVRIEVGGAGGAEPPPVFYVASTLSGYELDRGYLDAHGRLERPLGARLVGLWLVPVSGPRTAEAPDLAVMRMPWWGGVAVREGAETVVPVTLRRGGRLRIQVGDGPGELAGVAVAVRRAVASAETPLTRFGRQVIPGAGDFWIGVGLARPQVTAEELFEPGTYVLSFRTAGGGPPQEIPFEIRADQTTDVAYVPR